jgi:N-methylhydantoinase A
LSIVGVDIGGTFTDLVAYDDGRVITAKASTVPNDPTEGAAETLRLAGCDATAIRELLHGSTIAINTVLERKGARTALVTTAGFRDIYAIGRGNRPEAFNLFFHRPRPLVSRDLTFEVTERISADGRILTPLDDAEIAALAERLAEHQVEAVAVCFLHAYANPTHEAGAARLLRDRLPQCFVTASHEILREFREYERTSTTVLNAFVGPRVNRYLGRLEAFASAARFNGKIQIMRSNGGTMSIDQARRQPVAMMESGPVAGMIGAGRLAAAMGIEHAIGFDMGGTTAKATLITSGRPPIEEGYLIGGDATGQPMQLPVVDIVEVGAGGGSIAWRDQGNGLHVGPISAGADPGPACYGRGGHEPVVTDADLALGRLNGERFLGGRMRLDPKQAEAAIRDRIAQPMGLGLSAAALGIVRIADTAMSLAVRAVSVARGIDPRDTALIAFGGAGPLHATAVAREIYVPRVIVPKLPGNFSALGMLMAEWRQDFVRTLFGPLGMISSGDTQHAFAELRAAGVESLRRDRFEPEDGAFQFAADLRYRGQEHTIAIPVSGADDLTIDTGSTRERFHQQHERRYGHAAPDQSMEIVNLRLIVTVARLDDRLADWLNAPWVPTESVAEERRGVLFGAEAGPLNARVLWRAALPAGMEITGPAVIEEASSTTLVHPGDHAIVDRAGHLMITLAPTP